MKNGERLEFSFWEAGCLIWMGAKDLGGLSYQEFCHLLWGKNPTTFKQFVLEENAFLAMNLYQDDGYRVRVVLGDLNPQEAEEWVARVRWKLDLTCGAMIVSGILDEDVDEFMSMPSATDLDEDGILQCYVEVPPAVYQVEIYSYAPGDLSTGWGQIINSKLFRPTPGIQPESLRNYFQRTRQPEEISPWIAYELATETNADIENISQLYEEARQANYIDFMIRLTPVIEDNLPFPTINDDNSIEWEFRKPAKCPLGIVGLP
jgi:hypothetical protein